jgi:small conductance mechanosensitive channel
MDINKVVQTVSEQGTRIGFQVAGAILLWVVGRWVIGWVIRLFDAGLERQKVEETLANYITSTATGLLNVILIISILGAFGIQTATFAAIFAAVGLAIGTAWSGLLANFAAGVFLLMLRPFRVGDEIQAGDVHGSVVEIGPFATKIHTPDNIVTIVGNNKLLSDNIQNFSQNPYRRVGLTMQLNHEADVDELERLLRQRLAEVPNLLSKPAPEIEIVEINAVGPKLAVQPFCHNAHHDQVVADSYRVIWRLSKERGYLVPPQYFAIRHAA